MTLSYDEVARLALDAGFRGEDAATAVAIAKAESGFNAGVYGDAAYGGSIGLWQINLPANPQYDADSLRDPAVNARAAFALYQARGFNPWCTYKPSACGGAGNNAYVQYLDEARAAVSRIAGTGFMSAHPVLTIIGGVLLIGGGYALYHKHKTGRYPKIPRLPRLL